MLDCLNGKLTSAELVDHAMIAWNYDYESNALTGLTAWKQLTEMNLN